MPGVYDLLPTQKYYDIKGSFIKTIDYKNPINLFDDEVKDLNYQEFENYLIQDKSLNSQAFKFVPSSKDLKERYAFAKVS